jgi:uncharacterized protein YjeT (DUF2065 family)
MATADGVAARAGAQEARLRSIVMVLAVGQLGLGLFMALAPGAFFDAIADFGTRNDHYLRDVSTFYLAFGVVLLVAVGRPSWRAPALAFGALQYGLHALNHLIDVSKADPGWVGPFDFVSLAAVAGVFLYALRVAAPVQR